MEHNKKGFAAGFTLGAIAGSAIAILLYKNRRMISAKIWKLQAKADLHRRLKDLKRVTKDNYEELVDTVLLKYRSAKNIAEYEIEELSDELKRRWLEIKKEFDEAAE